MYLLMSRYGRMNCLYIQAKGNQPVMGNVLTTRIGENPMKRFDTKEEAAADAEGVRYGFIPTYVEWAVMFTDVVDPSNILMGQEEEVLWG